jgi:LysM repeat protein
MTDENEQRLAHLAYDLHDGPLQAVVALGTELELFRRQLADVLVGEDGLRARVLGRVADLTARLTALDDELRGFAHSLESPSLPGVPLRAALEHELDVVRRETDVIATLDVRGEVDRLTPTERLAERDREAARGGRSRDRVIEKAVTALAAVATLGFVAGALMASETKQSNGDEVLATKTVTVFADREQARATSERAAPLRYVVKRGDTLWAIAARHYDDVSDGMGRIKARNGLRRDKVLAGEVLILPAAGRRDAPTPEPS